MRQWVRKGVGRIKLKPPLSQDWVSSAVGQQRRGRRSDGVAVVPSRHTASGCNVDTSVTISRGRLEESVAIELWVVPTTFWHVVCCEQKHHRRPVSEINRPMRTRVAMVWSTRPSFGTCVFGSQLTIVELHELINCQTSIIRVVLNTIDIS